MCCWNLMKAKSRTSPTVGPPSKGPACGWGRGSKPRGERRWSHYTDTWSGLNAIWGEADADWLIPGRGAHYIALGDQWGSCIGCRSPSRLLNVTPGTLRPITALLPQQSAEVDSGREPQRSLAGNATTYHLQLQWKSCFSILHFYENTTELLLKGCDTRPGMLFLGS